MTRTTGTRVAAGAAAAVALAAVGVDGAAPATRAAMYGGVLIAAGMALFLVLAHDGHGTDDEEDRLSWIVLTAAAVGVVATIVGLGLQVAEVSGRGWSGVFDGDAADVVLGSSSHLGAGQRLVGLALLAYASRRWREGATVAPLLALAGVLVTLTSFFASGHAATREPREVGYVIDLVHTTTASVWAGGLVGLWVVLRYRRPNDPAGAADVVRRFSLAASGSVALLAATGVGLSWAELAPSGGVPFNGYGLVLVAKAAVALAALAVGAVNHYVVVPATRDGGQESWSTLSKTLRFELTAVVALVALTGVLTGLDP